MNNKWMKWVIGLGGISAFTLFLQTIGTDDHTSNMKENLVLNENTNVLNSQQNLATSTEEREKQLLALDWEENNWDVEYSNEAIIATPKSEMPYLDRAEQRTRRS